MKVGDLIRLSSMAVRVYELRASHGLIVDRIPSGSGYPDDYQILIDGAIHRMGFAIESSAEVINESR